MLVSGLITNVQVRPVPIKRGPRAGTMSNTYTITVDGKEIDCGFKCPAKTGEAFSSEVTDIPNKWGKFELLKNSSTAQTPMEAVASTPIRRDVNTGRSGFPIPKSDHATSICRQNALTASVNYHMGLVARGSITTNITVEDVLNVASQFARWTTGQLEQEEAERILKASIHEPNA